MDRDYIRISSADPDDPDPKTLLNLKTSWCVGKVGGTWPDYDWRALYRLANGEWLVLFETEFSGARYLRVTAKQAAEWCVNHFIDVPSELEGELEADCIGVAPLDYSSDAPWGAEGFVELPNGEIGIAMPLPSYPDEMRADFASKWQAFLDAPAQREPPTEAPASEAAPVQAAAVESARIVAGRVPAAPPNHAELNLPVAPSWIAERFGLDLTVLNKRLERWRRKHDDCCVFVSERKPREPKYLYYLKAVMPVIDDLRAASSEQSASSEMSA